MNDYLIGRKEAGIYAIRNLKTDRTYLGITEDIIKTRADERFALDLGIHSSTELQSDYTTTGLELFTIDLVREKEDGQDLSDLLKKTVKEYLDKGITLYQA